MQNNEFYEIARSYADKIRQVKPYYFMDDDNSFSVILTDEQELYTGITSLKITDAGVEVVPAEFNAIMSMIYASKSKVLQMAVIALSDYRIRIPSDECLDFLTRVEPTNTGCEILTAPDQSVTVEDFKTAFSPMSSDLFKIAPDPSTPSPSGTGLPAPAESASLGSPADFAAGFEFDAANPFFAGETEENSIDSPPPVQAISSSPVNPYADLRAQQPMGGFAQPYQQQMGFSQQQPMGGFAQPYRQQMGFSQQQPMGGSAQPYQQQMGFSQQQPMSSQAQPYQQQMGYSQQQPMSSYQQTAPYRPQNADINIGDDQVMKRRLSSLLNGGAADPTAPQTIAPQPQPTPAEPTMSREELLKRSKEMKKAAKLNEKMRKQF